MSVRLCFVFWWSSYTFFVFGWKITFALCAPSVYACFSDCVLCMCIWEVMERPTPSFACVCVCVCACVYAFGGQRRIWLHCMKKWPTSSSPPLFFLHMYRVGGWRRGEASYCLVDDEDDDMLSVCLFSIVFCVIATCYQNFRVCVCVGDWSSTKPGQLTKPFTSLSCLSPILPLNFCSHIAIL